MAGAASGPSAGRIVFIALGGTLLFVGLATLFAHLLEPFDATRAAAAGNGRLIVAADEAGEAVRRTIENVSPDLLDEAPGPPPEPVDVGPPPILPEGPLVAIIMTELGPNVPAARRALAALPTEISLTFSPYADDAPRLAETARATGHEVLVSIPMEPQRYPAITPGENVLLRTADESENLERLNWALSRFERLDGATGMMGSA
ncbi:MAG: divergent polysaccharide deacetylase family protein, partial [Pacificimonas sp.]